MTYIISIAVQIAVVIAVIGIVLLLVRQGRRAGPDETQTALDSLQKDLSLTQETLLHALGDRITRSAAETRQLVIERSESIVKLEGQMKEIAERQTELARRVQESNSHLTSLLHRHDELSVRLVELINRKMGSLSDQLAEHERKLPPEFAVLSSRVQDAIAQTVEVARRHEELARTIEARLSHAEGQQRELGQSMTLELTTAFDRLNGALHENQATLGRTLQQFASGSLPHVTEIRDKLVDLEIKQQGELASLKEQVRLLEGKIESFVTELERWKSGAPQFPDYGRFAGGGAIPLPRRDEPGQPDTAQTEAEREAPVC
jgi:hypothetical protein